MQLQGSERVKRMETAQLLVRVWKTMLNALKRSRKGCHLFIPIKPSASQEDVSSPPLPSAPHPNSAGSCYNDLNQPARQRDSRKASGMAFF